MNNIDLLKESIENQIIRSLNIIETNNNIYIIDLELSNGDKVEFGQNEGNVTIVLKPAREIEIERIKEELNKMKLGETRSFTLTAIDPDYLRTLALQRATELEHHDPHNVVRVNGSRCEVDLTDSYH